MKEYHILQKIRKGDIKAFEGLFHHFYPGMCTYAESLLNKQNVAEEVVQDVFYNIWKNRLNLNITSNWKSYLFKATFNNSMMVLRKAKKEMSLDDKWAESHLQSTDSTTEEIETKELNAIISYTLQSLPERTRKIFLLNRFEELKYREIAEKLTISVKTVEAHMGKALKALRTTLKDYRKTA